MKKTFLRGGEVFERRRGWLPYWGFCSKKVRTSIKKHRQLGNAFIGSPDVFRRNSSQLFLFCSKSLISSSIFLRVVIVLIGIGALAILFWEPRLEGRNINATNFTIYFKDPFLAYVYTASIAFFVAFCQAFKLVGYIGRKEVFSKHSVKALRTIKYCVMILVACVVGAEGYLFIVQRRAEEDIAGGVMMGLVMIFISLSVAAIAAIFEKKLQSAVDISMLK